MPSVHIFRLDFNQERNEHLGDAVHRAHKDGSSVPPDVLIQALSTHVTDSLLWVTPALLGSLRSADAVFVQIAGATGRTTDQNQALFASIVAHANKMTDIYPEGAIINLLDSGRENWPFGNGLSQLAA